MSTARAVCRAAGYAMVVAWLAGACGSGRHAGDDPAPPEGDRDVVAAGLPGHAGDRAAHAPMLPPAVAAPAQPSPEPTTPPAAAGSGVGAPAASDGARRLLGVGPDEESVLRALALATPRRIRPVGTTSVVLKLDLGATIDGAFKPRTTLHPLGWLAEIAAYRVARCLGLDDVPPAVTRTLRREQLRERIDPENAAQVSELESAILWDGDLATGVAIQWIRGLTPLGLEREHRVVEWSAWLSQAGGPVPPEHAELARDLSNALVFDYVIGNFDRWSGSNLGGTPDGRRLYLRDHNLAFASPLPHEQSERLWRRLGRAERFSRSLVITLRRLDAAQLSAELARDPSLRDRPRLVAGWVRDVLRRRDAVLSHVGALIDEHTAARVLVFP